MWKFWDRIYCINLDRRPDRWSESLAEFDRMGLNGLITRFPAIDLPHGGMGCYASHISVMEESLASGLDNVLILEDDIKFIVDRETLEKSFKDLLGRDWDAFFIGTRTLGPANRVTDNLVRLWAGSCTHAIGYTERALKLSCRSLKKQYRKNNPPHYFVPIDSVGIYEYIRDLNCFGPYPLACVQRKSHSDLHNHFVDYEQDNIREYRDLCGE